MPQAVSAEQAATAILHYNIAAGLPGLIRSTFLIPSPTWPVFGITNTSHAGVKGMKQKRATCTNMDCLDFEVKRKRKHLFLQGTSL